MCSHMLKTYTNRLNRLNTLMNSRFHLSEVLIFFRQMPGCKGTNKANSVINKCFISAGLLAIKFKGNYKEMTPRMCLMEIRLSHRCGRDRCAEDEVARQDWWA